MRKVILACKLASQQLKGRLGMPAEKLRKI